MIKLRKEKQEKVEEQEWNILESNMKLQPWKKKKMKKKVNMELQP